MKKLKTSEKIKAILDSGHYAAAQNSDGDWEVFMYIDGRGNFQGSSLCKTIEISLEDGTTAAVYSEEQLAKQWSNVQVVPRKITYFKPRKVLELFAGSRSIGKVCDKRGIDVFSSDIEQFGGIDYIVDILEFDYQKVPFVPDVIWASPPCTAFSVASIGHHWTGGKGAYIPKTDGAILGKKLVEKTIEIIEYYKKINPNLIWYIENPRGLMRKMPFMEKLPIRHTVTYCQYGDTRMKPTDIWTNNTDWKPRPMCKNGAPCHVSAPRGSRTGTQGLKNNHERSKIPEQLCIEIIEQHD